MSEYTNEECLIPPVIFGQCSDILVGIDTSLLEIKSYLLKAIMVQEASKHTEIEELVKRVDAFIQDIDTFLVDIGKAE